MVQAVQVIQARPVRRKTNDIVRLRDTYFLCLSKWYWFVISLVLCLLAASLYIAHQTPIYKRTASILIKESKGGSSVNTDFSALGDLSGMIGANANVMNELTTITTDAVVLETVKRLHLDMQYTIQEIMGLRTKVLYGGRDLAYTVKLDKLNDNSSVSFDMEMTDDNRLLITNLSVDGENFPDEYNTKLNSTIKIPAGELTVVPTPDADSAKLKSMNGTPIHVTRTGYVKSVELCRSKLSAELDNNKNTIIKLTYNDPSIQRAEEFLNTLISIYNENWVKDKNQISVSTSEFINERLKVIEKELGNVDSDISSYKSANQIPDLEAAANMYMNKASQANAQVLELNNVLYMARYIRSFISNQANAFQLLPANSGLNNPIIESRITEYNEKLFQRNSIISNSSTNNPMVQRLNEGLTELRTTIISSIDNLIASLNQQISSYRGIEAQSTAHLSTAPKQAKQLLSVERQQKVKEALYLFLLQKREENELSQAFTAYNTRVINPPTGSLAPISPERDKILLIAILLGIVVPLIIIVVKDSLLNTKIRSKKDLKDLTIPYVGEIPLIKKSKTQENAEYDIVVQEKSRNIANEAFRVVRTNMEFMFDSTKRHRVMMITSSNPGSGKTFLCANLAMSLAVKGLKVAMIDLDMRRSSLSSFVGTPDEGISNFLNNQIKDWQNIVVASEDLHPNISVIPVGAMPPNPTELLFNPKMEALMEELKQQFDYVLLDCPPVEIVADADIINKWVDLTIFVIRAGLFDKEILPEVENYYQEKKYKNMAILLNGTEAAHGKYGYGRYGRYGYGKYGCYGNDKKKKK